MIIFSIFLAIIWLLFTFYQQNGFTLVKEKLTTLFLLNFLIAVLFLFLFSYFNFFVLKLFMGLIILISGLQQIGILQHDLFTFMEKKWELNVKLPIQQISLVICWLSFLSEMDGTTLEKILTSFVFLLFLAGLLHLMILKFSRLKNESWLKDLMITLSGLFLVINSLIYISGDVRFFLGIFEKILHTR